MVAELKPAPDTWRRQACDDRCELRMVIVPGLLGRQTLEIHDPEAHEEYGRALAGDVSAGPLLKSGPLVVDRRQKLLWVQGQEVVATRTEWEILAALMDGAGRLVRREEVLTKVWGSAGAEEGNALGTHLARLRARLGIAAGLIETIGWIGMRFLFLPPGEIPAPPKAKYATLPQRGKWARDWPHCRRCEQTTSKHRARGYCEACYKRLEREGAFDRDEGAP